MTMILLIILGAGAFILQTFLGFVQIKHFGLEYSRMRQDGRVAIGRRPGKIKSGTIVMFSLDETGIIKYSRKMQGTSIVARFKDLAGYEGIKLEEINREATILKKENKLTAAAILNAIETYNLVVNGQPIPETKAPLARAADKIKGLALGFSKG